MTAPAVQAPQLPPEQVARIRAAMQTAVRQFAKMIMTVARALVELFRCIGRALRSAIKMLVRLADQLRVRLRVMHLEYRRRLRHRRRRAR